MVLIAQPSYLLRTLKDGGYKNTSYALAELVDNSIEANATNILISIQNGRQIVNNKSMERIKKVGIYDNGDGMDNSILSKCLAIGWGTRRDNPKGLGKFGIGLKGASISMADRIEVFSWQNSGNPLYTYLDFQEIDETNQLDIPPPIEKEIPSELKCFLDDDNIGKAGTLIIWSKLDEYRFYPKQAETLLTHLNNDMCRIFRHFMDDDDQIGKKRKIEVRLINQDKEVTDKVMLKPNDPMYLLTPNNLPGYENKPTNEKIDKITVNTIDIYNSQQKIEVILSVALPEIQKLGGNSEIGKHYLNNNGISFIRSGRELELNDKGFFPQSEPRVRWLGIEIRFPPQLDDYFGVTNNKQAIRKFLNFNESDLEQLIQITTSNPTENEFNEAKMLLDLHNAVSKLYKKGEKIIKSRGEGTRQRGGNITGTTATKVSEQLKKTESNVKTSSSEEAAKKTKEEKIKEMIDLQMKSDTTLTEEEAKMLAEAGYNNWVDIVYDDWPGEIFIDVKNRGNAAIGIINRDHPFYNKFHDHLKNAEDKKGFEAMKILLMALVRAEDVLKNQIGEEKLEKIRGEWGRYLKDFLKLID